MKITQTIFIALCLNLNACSKAEDSGTESSAKSSETAVTNQGKLVNLEDWNLETAVRISGYMNEFTRTDENPIFGGKILYQALVTERDPTKRDCLALLLYKINYIKEICAAIKSLDTMYLINVRDPILRKQVISDMRKHYVEFESGNKENWNQQLPKLEPFKSDPFLASIINAYDAHLKKLFTLAAKRLGENDLASAAK